MGGSDVVEAIAYLEKAAGEFSQSDTMVNLGSLYEHGWTGVSANNKKAAEWYLLAAEADNPKGMNKYGYMRYKGRGVELNYRDAVKWFEMGAALGDGNAHNNLGICYELGRGVGVDIGLARASYNRAAELGHPSGKNNLAFMLIKEVNIIYSQ